MNFHEADIRNNLSIESFSFRVRLELFSLSIATERIIYTNIDLRPVKFVVV